MYIFNAKDTSIKIGKLTPHIQAFKLFNKCKDLQTMNLLHHI